MGSPDLLIVGAGAAGLSAAATALDLGLTVEMIDERPAPGGNFFAGVDSRPPGDTTFGPDYGQGWSLLARAQRAKLHKGAVAWRIERDGTTYIADEAGARRIAPARLLVATGAMERPIPIPGATLPGVMYAGAAQLLLKTAGMLPRGRCVLVGSGPLLLLLATQLLQGGVASLSIVETTPQSSSTSAAHLISAAFSAPGTLLKGIDLIGRVAASRVPWHRCATNVSVEGEVRARAVEFKDRSGTRRSIDADLVLLHDGVIPNDHVTRQLGCLERWNAGQHCFHPVVNDWGETSVPGIFAAGDCTGIWGVQSAKLSGQLVALEIARQLGRIGPAERDSRAHAPRNALKRHRAVRPFLEERFPPTLSRASKAPAATIICRCENVTAGEIRLAVRQGATGPDQLKAFTRCGMGPCQGRSCSMAAAEIMAEELGVPIEEIGRQDIRAPLKPLPLGKIASLQLEPVP